MADDTIYDIEQKVSELKSKEKIKNLEKQMLSKVKIAYKTNPRFKQLMDKHKIAIN